MLLFATTLALVVHLSLAQDVELCPTYERRLMPQSWGRKPVKVMFLNWAQQPLILGVHEHSSDQPKLYTLRHQGQRADVEATPGSVVRVINEETEALLFERMILPHDGTMGTSSIFPCGNVSYAEYEALLVKDTTCDSALPTKRWNCVRPAPPREEWPKERYGFTPEEVAMVPTNLREYGPYETEANTEWDAPTFTDSGYVLMKMPSEVYKAALRVYQQGVNQSEIEGDVPGHYSNFFGQEKEGNAWTMINLDRFQKERSLISDGVRRMLTWWAKVPLQHEATYGIRVYHRNAALLNHRDVSSTHVVSAVLQVAQNAEEGWPLLVGTQRNPIKYAEVYLQPGYMALYEGARLKHGRPMRFNGTEFAMVFTHNRPIEYYSSNVYKDEL